MDPYVKPGERKIGSARPKVQHVAPDSAKLTNRSERQIEKQAVGAQRRAIKKSARRHLQKQLESELNNPL